MTETEKLEIAREAAALFWEASGDTAIARDVLDGLLDEGPSVATALAAVTLMLERGYVPMPSVEDVHNASRALPLPVYFTKEYAEIFHAAIFPQPMSRIQQAREALGIAADVPDETVAKWIGEIE